MQTQNYVELETDLVKVEQLDEDDLIWLSQFTAYLYIDRHSLI